MSTLACRTDRLAGPKRGTRVRARAKREAKNIALFSSRATRTTRRLALPSIRLKNAKKSSLFCRLCQYRAPVNSRQKGITATTDSARMFPLLRFETMKIRQTIDPLDKGKIFSFSIRKFTVVSRPSYVLTFSHFICCSLAFFFFFFFIFSVGRISCYWFNLFPWLSGITFVPNHRMSLHLYSWLSSLCRELVSDTAFYKS